MKNNISKKFTKLIPAVIIASLALTGCNGKTAQEDDSSAAEATTEAAAAPAASSAQIEVPQEYDLLYSGIKQVLPNEMIKMDSNNLLNTYGIDASTLESYFYLRSEDIMKADTIIVAKVSDQATIDQIKEKLTTVNESKALEYQNYAPEQYDILQKAVISDKNNYVYYVVAPNSSEITRIIEKNI